MPGSGRTAAQRDFVVSKQVRHKNKFRDYAYMLFVGHEAEHGETLDPHEKEEASDERQIALAAVNDIAGARSLGWHTRLLVRGTIILWRFGDFNIALLAWTCTSVELRKAVPNVAGDAPGEVCNFPQPGEQGTAVKGCTEENSVFVDSFLYDDEAMETLFETNPPRLSRSYCPDVTKPKECLPLNFLSHSLDLQELGFIFSSRCLGNLMGRTICDVGSRLGPVLWGAYHLSSAKRIIGVEMNSWFCDMQRNIVKSRNMGDRITVIETDICSEQGQLQLREADVVVLHNVFEFFGDSQAVERCWTTVRECVSRKGQRLVTVPSLEEAIQKIDVAKAPNLREWVAEIPLAYPEKEVDPEQAQSAGIAGEQEGSDSDDNDDDDEDDEDEEFTSIKMYVVK